MVQGEGTLPYPALDLQLEKLVSLMHSLQTLRRMSESGICAEIAELTLRIVPSASNKVLSSSCNRLVHSYSEIPESLCDIALVSKSVSICPGE